MNERIRELSKQAGDYVNETYTGPVRSKTPGKIWEDGHIGWHTQFNEKFAELIVRECVRVCNKQIPNWKGEYATAFGDGVEFCISGIKEHFGIEE